MNAEPSSRAEAKSSAESWSFQRWIFFIALALAAHAALIFIFGSKKTPVPRAATRVLQFRLAGDNSLIALTDPTLFALPHLDDFAPVSGLRLNVSVQPSFRWTEPPLFLALSPATLGADFNAFIRTNQFSPAGLNFKPEPRVAMVFTPYAPPLPQASTLRLAGEIAQRRMLNHIDVPSLPYNDVLNPSRVQVLVDENGDVVSDVLLESSEFDQADQTALELARRARFAPATGLTPGMIIFNWHTVPVNSTNTP
jgi:TonB family protein